MKNLQLILLRYFPKTKTKCVITLIIQTQFLLSPCNVQMNAMILI